MHEPGPPRTTSVGEAVELAPRRPDPDGVYEWHLRDAPVKSVASEGDRPRTPDGTTDTAKSPVLARGHTARTDSPVVHLRPDAPGMYVLELDAPDGTHRQRVRVFPDERRQTELRVAASDLPVDDGDVDRISLMWPHNDRLIARERPDRDGDEWVIETRVPPGHHTFSFVVNDTLENHHHDAVDVSGPGRPRLSLDATVVDHREHDPTLVLTADVDPPPKRGDQDRPDGGTVEFLVDDRDADAETVSQIESFVDGHTLAIPVGDIPDGLRIHAIPHAERYGAMETVQIDRIGDGSVRVTDPHAPPQWADSPTIYEAFVRSFAGETLPTTFREIERRVPYIESLGVDALWLTPVLASPTEHGYHVTDYYDTAADLGSQEAFESLVETCHEAGVRVIFDLVINHTSRDHPAFQMHAAGVDAYADHYRRAAGEFDVTDTDWAEITAGDMPEYYFNWGRIPNLNFDSPTVREWLLDVVDKWAAVVDGFRADVAWGVPHGFWKEVSDRVPDGVLLLDETLPHDPFYGEGEFDLHYDTSLYAVLREIGGGEMPADAIADAFDRATWLGFDDPAVQMRYIENHDEERYRAEYGEAAQRAAAAVTFTLPGAPMIYAGQERGNETSRGPVRWHDGDNSSTDFHRTLAALRDAEPLLRDGAVAFDGAGAAVTVIEGNTDQVTAYERIADAGNDEKPHLRDSLLVVVNFGSSAATVTVPDGFETDLFAETAAAGRDAAGTDDRAAAGTDDRAAAIQDDGTIEVDSLVVLR